MTLSGYAILGAAASPSQDADVTLAPVSHKTDAGARADALAYLNSLVGTPYVWASKDPSKGLDCSGAVTVAYEHAGLARPGARFKYGSADLHNKLRSTSDPKGGDLAFYGSGGKVSHVMMCTGDGRVIGATGGGRNTKTADDARAIGAYVKYKASDYRKDLVGYGSAPSVTSPLDGSPGAKLDTSDSRDDLREKLLYGAGLSIVGVLGALGIHWWRSAR